MRRWTEKITVTPTGSGAQALLGFTHYENADAGFNILPRIISTSPNLAGELPTGTYSFWIQETGGTVPYSFDFQVTAVPEPEAFGMAALGLLTILRRVRRRRSA
jgi:hypothetical protein